MTVNEKIKTIDKKIEKNKAQYNLDRQATNISVFSSRNVGEYEFLTSKNILQEKAVRKSFWKDAFQNLTNPNQKTQI